MIVESLPGLTVIGEVSTGTDALEAAKAEALDLMLLDYSMPGMTGLDVLIALRRRKLATRVLVLTAVVSEAIIAELREAGTDGLCLKQDAGDELASGIEAVMAGNNWMSARAREIANRQSALTALTRRERQILLLIAQGNRNRDIAEKLSISAKTVDTHRTNLMGKLDVHSLAGLIEFAARAGLLDDARPPKSD